MMDLQAARLAARFWFEDAAVAPLGDGHIHQTFAVTCTAGVFVLQRVNQVVFPDLTLLGEQTQQVLGVWQTQTRYIAPQLLSPGYHVDESGCWRMWEHLSGRVIDPPENYRQVRAAGEAFARFQVALQGLEPATLSTTIPGFLQLSHYLREFEDVASLATPEWTDRVAAERDIGRALTAHPAHIHADCKINNLLFDADSDQVSAILDFDTVMWAPRALDLGDLVRSVCVSQGKVDLMAYTAVLEGFKAGGVELTVAEVQEAPAYLAFMLALRFYTDHLRGDTYFNVAYRGENLERAERQYALFLALRSARTEFEQIAETTMLRAKAPDGPRLS